MFNRQRNSRRSRRRRAKHGLIAALCETMEVRRVLAAPVDPVVITDVQYPDPSGTLVNFTPIDGAERYDIWVSDASYQPRLAQGGTGVASGDSFTHAALGNSTLLTIQSNPGRRLRAWLRGVNDDGAGPWGPAFHILIPGSPPRDQVQFSSNASAAYSGEGQPNLALEWDSLELFGASRYEIWADLNGTRVVNDETTAAEFQSADLETGLYKVWVRGESDAFNGPWSRSMLIAVGADRPEITGPVQNEAPLRPEITWSAGLEGLDYQVWVQNDDGVIINQAGITGTSFTPESDLAQGLYSVWVRQVSDSGTALPWSSRYRFAVGESRLPGTPVLQFTANLNGDSVEDFRAIFTWDAAANVDHYELFISRWFDGVQVFGSEDLTGTEYVTPVLESGIRRAWLRGIGANGELGVWSNFIQFEVQATNGEVVLWP